MSRPLRHIRALIRALTALVFAMLFTSGCAATLMQTAEGAVAQGEWDRAVAAYQEALKADPLDEGLRRRLGEAKVLAAEAHYARGQKARKDGRIHVALEAFQHAVGLHPSRREYHLAMMDALRVKKARDHLRKAERLRHLGRLEEAMGAYERAVELDPHLKEAANGITAVSVARQARDQFGEWTEPLTMRFQEARLKEVFEVLARSSDINVVFDKDVRNDPVTIFIEEMPFDQALSLVLTTQNLASRRLDADTLLVFPESKQKQERYRDLMIRTFYLSNAKAKDMINLLRTMLDSKRVYVNEQLNAIVIRDTPEKLRLAERIILANDRRGAEVELALEVLEVNRTKSLEYGFNFAKSAGAGVRPPGSTGGLSTVPVPFTFRELTSLGAESYLFTLPASILLDFFKQASDAKTLAAPKLRVLSNEKASVAIGDKQPILLSTTNVIPGQPTTGGTPTTSTVTSIEFKDTGVKLTVEPTIHLMDELTLKLQIEITRLGDEVTLQSSPVIKQFKFGSRSAETILNMRDGETVVLAGLIQEEQRQTRVSVPWLGDIPVLGELFSATTTDTVQTEVVLTITPRIIRNVSAPSLASQVFWSGTEHHYETQPLFPVERGGASRELPLGTGEPEGPLHGPPAPHGSSTGQDTVEDAAEGGQTAEQRRL